MFQLYCPVCREARAEEEFRPKGEARIIRPPVPEAASDEEWADYLYFRTNPKGLHTEQWVHAAGCRKIFLVVRDTVSHEVAGSWALGEAPVVVEGAAEGDSR
ncbi:MAG: sarcosine oxidase subunit delta [Rhodocyclaceae bacterium]|jgi:sarcosine oxidase subunit delta|nr:sarcosine oxidase subunit delta [Rhodocyclaceae bacterium]MCL4758073.1 sarcosine oxidase subunit delta [Rhodocyclaceae bacterium]